MPRHKPKFNEKVFFLFSGAIISVPFSLLTNSLVTYFFALNLPHFYAAGLPIIVFGPVFEEFAKSYPLYYRHGETEKSLMTLGWLTGLGFGLVEFCLYVFYYQAPILARLPLILFHASNTAIVAYGIGKGRIILFFLLAALLHGLNNFGALAGGKWHIINFIVIIFSYSLAIYLHTRAREEYVS